MRPAGEIRQALQAAASEMATIDGGGQEHGPTFQELAARAKVGAAAALVTVKNMTRAGALRVVNQRKVPYRNKPVAEYAPAKRENPEDEACIDVASVFSVWARG